MDLFTLLLSPLIVSGISIKDIIDVTRKSMKAVGFKISFSL